ncbi:hypothetical protein JTE90_014332 [Oedothorax gibbosus]|uniref:SWIM-type domain-containing protein n=1 Tax=Oedothorax gibbosus TaxID=931172 RepID=A0AAV6TSV2_9ARAC|nr:hypothetical protein JTE90_014332 [Oedothorax gibbosus]
MENYYKRRLLEFANSRNPSPRLYLSKIKKCALEEIMTKDRVHKIEGTDYQYIVQGTKNDYLVDARSACCSCPAGMFGKFCKHQFAVTHYFNVYLQNFPTVTTKDRHEIAHLALGDKTPTIDFYRPLIENCSTPIVQPDVEEQAIVPIATTVEVSSEKEMKK